jgi:hypothetical protein
VSGRGGVSRFRVLPLAAALGVNGAAVAALEDMVALVASAVGVNEGESTFKAFFWLYEMLADRFHTQFTHIRLSPPLRIATKLFHSSKGA